jgi:adenylosuccinate lyase
MPHKRNPNQSRNLVIQSRKIRRNAEVLLDWMVSIHERDQISSAGELKEICLNTDRLLKAAKPLLKNLVVKPDAMLQNLGKTKGLIMAEEMMFVLGKKIGKHTAHEEVRKVTQEAFQKGITFKEALLSHPEIAKNLNPEELDTLLDPTRYIGLSPQAVDRLIEETQKFRATDPS